MNPYRFTVVIAALAAAAVAQSPSTFAPEPDFLANNVFGQMPWKELGPVACGGRIVDIAVHPQNASVFWVAEAYHQNFYRTHPHAYTEYHENSGRREFLRAHWGPAADY